MTRSAMASLLLFAALDKPVLFALQNSRYQPLIFEGKTVAVDYVFKFRFKLG